MFIVAKQTIKAGTELTYHYNLDLNDTELSKALTCLCEASECSGIMGLKLPPSVDAEMFRKLPIELKVEVLKQGRE